MDSLVAWFQGLGARERRFVAGGAIGAAVLLVFAVLLPPSCSVRPPSSPKFARLNDAPP